MENNIEKIELEMRSGSVPPHSLAEYRAQLAGEYSFLSGQMEKILMEKPYKWIELRKTASSDNATDKMWDATLEGLTETRLKLRMKKIEKMGSALKSLIDVADAESRNNY